MELLHFNQLRMSLEEEPAPIPNMDRYLEWTFHLKQNFSNRFQNFELISELLNFLHDPFQFLLSKIEHVPQIFTMDCARLEIDLIMSNQALMNQLLNGTQSSIRLLCTKILN